jgi:hypothetical protein
MVTGQFDNINRYLGFTLKSEAEVPKGTGKDKVVRKRRLATGATGSPKKTSPSSNQPTFLTWKRSATTARTGPSPRHP